MTRVINIIVVVINDKNGLQRTLNSIYDQNVSADSYRVVVVDGFSKDGTYELAKSNTRKQDSVLQSAPRGIYDAMNIGLLHVFQYPDSDAVVFLNAGDFFFSKESINFLAFGISHHSQVAGLSTFLDTDNGLEVSLPKTDFSSFESPVQLWIPHQAFCATVGTYRSVGLMDTRFRIAGDIDWFVRSTLINGKPHPLSEVISVQMVGGRSRINAYSGYLERIEIAKINSLRVDRYPMKLLLKVYVAQKLSCRLPRFLRKKMPRSLKFEGPTIERFKEIDSRANVTDRAALPED